MRGDLSVRQTCQIVAVPRSSYYASKIPSQPRVVEPAIERAMRQIHRKSKKSLGARTMAANLCERGFPVGREQTATFMRIVQLKAKQKRFRHYSRNTKPAPAPNLLNRQFDRAHPNEVWACDITYIPTRKGWLYLAIVVDLFSRRIVGWDVSTVADTQHAIRALELAFGLRGAPRGVMVHSDQGCQYTADLFVACLHRYGAIQSMSRRGNCWDNAVVERVFRSLKQEWIDAPYANQEEAARDVIDYVARYYNHERLHSSLNYVSPARFEALAA